MADAKKIAKKKIKRRIIGVVLSLLGELVLLYIKVIAIVFLLIKVNILSVNDLYNNQSLSMPTTTPTSSDTDIVQTITGDTYYVSNSGSDSNSGESESSALHSISAGIEKLKPGDGLIIKAGTYNYNGTISISKKGEEGKPIIIRADGEVIFDGNGRGGNLFTVRSGASYINIEGITFKNLNANEARGICLKSGCNNINILNCNFDNIKTPNPAHKYNTANAIYFEGSGSTRDKAIDHIIIKNCTMKNICAGWSEGISIDGNCTNITVDGVTATAPDVKSNIAICVCGHDSGTNSNPNVNRPEHIKITNCNVSDCVSPYGDDSYGIYVDGGYDVTISNNTVTKSEGGIEVGAENKAEGDYKGSETEKIVVQNNTLTDCKEAMYIGGYDKSNLGTVKDVTVTGNTFTKCGSITFGNCVNVKVTGNERNGTKYEYEREGAKDQKNLTTD